MEWINDNGTLRDADVAIHGADSSAALYGDGLFETMRFEEGTIQLWERHWARLSEGCKLLLLPLSQDKNASFFKEEIVRTIAANGIMNECRVRLQLFSQAPHPSPGYAVVCAPLPGGINSGGPGLRLGIAESVVKNPGTHAHLKTCNALPYSIATREAKTHGWDDAILLNSAGRVVETTKSNIFFAKGGTMFVGAVAEGCIAGVMRAQVMEWLPQWGFPVIERSLEVDELLAADEVFLTNAIRRVQAVTEIGGTTFSSTLTRRIAVMVERKLSARHQQP